LGYDTGKLDYIATFGLRQLGNYTTGQHLDYDTLQTRMHGITTRTSTVRG